MSKLSRVILGAVVVTATSPLLVLTPATAATTVPATSVAATTTVAASPSQGVPVSPTTTSGLCRIFPKLCVKVASAAGGSAA